MLTDKAVQFATAKNYVFSHSVLCVGGTDQDQSFSERARKLAAENVDINDVDDSKCPYNLSISRANVPHLEKVCSNLRQQLKRKPVDKMEDLDVHSLIWRMFLIVTQQAAVHLGNDYVDNLHATRIFSHKEQLKQFSDVTSKLVGEQTEIQGISLIE